MFYWCFLVLFLFGTFGLMDIDSRRSMPPCNWLLWYLSYAEWRTVYLAFNVSTAGIVWLGGWNRLETISHHRVVVNLVQRKIALTNKQLSLLPSSFSLSKRICFFLSFPFNFLVFSFSSFNVVWSLFSVIPDSTFKWLVFACSELNSADFLSMNASFSWSSFKRILS